MVIFPLLSTGISLLCAWVLGRDAIRRPRPDKVIWTIAFLLFALAAGADAVGRELGWSTWLAKLYYATGPVLVVMYLAIGELYLLAPGKMRRFGIGLTASLTAFWLSLVLGAPVDQSRLATDGWDAIERDGFMTVVTIVLNTISTLIIVGGTAYTIWKFSRKGIARNRMIGCAWILVGTLFVAAGGSLTRLGHYEYLYIAMLIGVAMIFYGVLWTRRPETVPVQSFPTTSGIAPRVLSAVPAVEVGTPPRSVHSALVFVETLLQQPAEDVARTCAEWSVPVDHTPVFSRLDARLAWAFRQGLPEESQVRFDALPVPARRQLSTLYREVLVWAGDEQSLASAPNGVESLPGNEADLVGDLQDTAGTRVS